MSTRLLPQLLAYGIVGLSVAYVLLMLITVPNTHSAGIDREHFKSVIEASSVAAADANLKGSALVLFNGYEGSQFLLKLSTVFGVAFVAAAISNAIIVWRLLRSLRREGNESSAS